jgi:hypothetical protein
MISTQFLAAMLLAWNITASLAQEIFINLVPEYSSLESCAVGPISTIVRNMALGCGDEGATTSYSCFCTESSTHWNDVIASSVSAECSGTVSDVVSALEVFQSYCSLGDSVEIISSSSCEFILVNVSKFVANVRFLKAASTSSPANTSAKPSATATQGLHATESSDSAVVPTSSHLSSGAKAGIAIGVIAVALAFTVAFVAFVLRHRRRSMMGKQERNHFAGTTYMPSSTSVNDIGDPMSPVPLAPVSQEDWGWQPHNIDTTPSYPVPLHPAQSHPPQLRPSPSFHVQTYSQPSYPAPSYPAPSYSAPSYPTQSYLSPITPDTSNSIVPETFFSVQELSSPVSAPRHELSAQPDPKHELES